MKPARKQVEESILKVGSNKVAPADQSGTFYNIWYNKWSGGEKVSKFTREKATTRCNVKLDAGETKGDKIPDTYFCLYFARGCCPFGHECNYWHRIPTESDPVDTTIDSFGRDKFSEYREDMGGIGSFNRENRTLYVGHVTICPDMEAIVRKHFEEWGEIEKIKILKDKGVAFVTYYSSLNAEFAKEAMSNQSLDRNEVLNVRWATDDPNPRAKAEFKRKAEAMAAQAIIKNLPAEFTLANTDFISKRPRIDDNINQDSLVSEEFQNSDELETYEDQQHGHQPNIKENLQSVKNDSDSTSSLKSNSIVSSETLESLKVLSQGLNLTNYNSTSKTKDPTTEALTELAAYGSDDDQESEEEKNNR
ncbi:11288_t:CDS:2 [Funneliformis caledonium]|uniref:11288_t:CDS:1 n=1 Tax=Funneliformis caledonium TaxID=1117310 RepID=A0A9N8VKQ5_9GLOM|nr:11288_t:CDS:2 [Funneliformis caledonium]